MAADNTQILRALRKIPLWDGLNNTELDTVFHQCHSMQLAADNIIFNEADASHDLYILLSGQVNIITKKKGVIHTVHENETFGEIGLITQKSRSASALSTEDCIMLKLNHLEFNTLLGTHPRISAIMLKNITASLSQHIVRMNQCELEHLPADKKTEKESPRSVVLSPDAAAKY